MSSEPKGNHFIGIDVGTGSVRVALVNQNGNIISCATKDIQTFRSVEGDLEQSSDNIWQDICECVRTVSTGYQESIVGIGVCATCSLVAVTGTGSPVTVSRLGKPEQNIILWMDHRAKIEADEINATKHPLLNFVGGQVSVEMQMPKLLWLKKNLKYSFDNTTYFFDLPDYVTFKLTGSDVRSICSVVCKWNYDADSNCWDTNYLKLIGLTELTENNFSKIGTTIQQPGTKIPGGLSVAAAKELGLHSGIAVATSMIDAHSGALPLLGCGGDLFTTLGVIAGTSSCHMSITKAPVFTKGVWGPYKNAIFEYTYLNEAGQSASGYLLDFILETHSSFPSLKEKFGNNHKIVNYLNSEILKLGGKFYEVTKDLHIWPDFHGNRSPLADPNIRGMISGLSLAATEKQLSFLYLAKIQALAFNTKHILEKLYDAGRPQFKTVLMCGGLSKNSLFVQVHADILEIPIGLPETTEAVLLGSSIMGACAAGAFETLQDATCKMCGNVKFIQPNTDSFGFYRKKYKVFLKMIQDQLDYKRIMDGSN